MLEIGYTSTKLRELMKKEKKRKNREEDRSDQIFNICSYFMVWICVLKDKSLNEKKCISWKSFLSLDDQIINLLHNFSKANHENKMHPIPGL